MNSVIVSVIVPTYNRRDMLLRLLDSLLTQSMPGHRYEIIVVSDGSTDGTSEAVMTLAARHPQLRFIDRSRGGPAAARNAAAAEARGSYLAFTDDDCVAAPDWLEKLVEALERPQTVAVQGRTTTVAGTDGPLTHYVVNETKSYVAPTCNVACRSDIFRQLGGFDERFRFPHNEDVDLAWRFESVGVMDFAAGAVIVHPPCRVSFFRKAARVRYLESEFLLFYKHPARYREHRSSSPWRTIYWQVCVVFQLQGLRSSLRFLLVEFHPHYFCLAVGLVIARWWNLIRLFPQFHRAAVKYRALCRGGQSEQEGRLAER